MKNHNLAMLLIFYFSKVFLLQKLSQKVKIMETKKIRNHLAYDMIPI